MNETVVENQAEETQEINSAEKTDGSAMPPEERSIQAARRRAVEARAKELRENAREQQLRQEVLEHPLVKEAMTLLQETRFKKDLERVREAYPGMTAQSPDEIGEIYCRLMAGGLVDPVVAYEAQQAADRRANPVPSDMASAKSAGGAALFYSSRELDALTPEDLKDPQVFQKALASLSKLRS